MALAIMVSTFGCANGLILPARAFTTHGAGWIIFPQHRTSQRESCARDGSVLQGIWAAFLVLLAQAG